MSSPDSNRSDALAVVRKLCDAGHVAYFAGGCVRDLLLGKSPGDYDVATDAPPARVRKLFINTQAVGAAFGVILVRIGTSTIEVATFRADEEYRDGRHPVAVRFTSAGEDARRRDFTINGLFLDPLAPPDHDRIIDFVGGRDDLAAGVIRAIGNPTERFDEDSLRLLRAVRFAARLGFTIEPATAAAIAAHAPQLKRITPERIADELRHMLTASTRAAAWQLLLDLHLAPEIFRFLPPRATPPRSGRIPPVFELLSSNQPTSFGLSLAAAYLSYRTATDLTELLAPPSIKSATRAMRQALRISNEESADFAGTLDGLHLLLTDPPPGIVQQKRFLARPTAPSTRQLLAALAAAGLLPANRAIVLESELARLSKTDYAPTPLLTGDHLIAMGLKPGRQFKRILDAVYDSQLAGAIQTLEEARQFAQRLSNARFAK
ncbi:MAG TPA: CCA tRNA nucleotidyltransferase [Tepidisphaeraceae bacterium]|nr:CCA tRNA nucleotidyltransferase [Tepidisphaeraceae bacterium]